MKWSTAILMIGLFLLIIIGAVVGIFIGSIILGSCCCIRRCGASCNRQQPPRVEEIPMDPIPRPIEAEEI
ncbi:hypothetical protein NPIL_350681 [Nephila pilipes]|uniref:Transmembrane protein n=1 Tax=Nephila pilipes TaxID=299642 RepID=A0A8X6IEU8_NEPPI|nr:hypothetical protein NPIL_350681 [Nephila pilipes]